MKDTNVDTINSDKNKITRDQKSQKQRDKITQSYDGTNTYLRRIVP